MPAREHRPCPRCGARIGRRKDNPLLCQFCSTPLRPSIAWTVLAVLDTDTPSTVSMTESEARVSRAKAAVQAREHKNAGRDIRIVAECDCGWTSGQHIGWSGLDPEVTHHRWQHERGHL